MLTVAMLLSAVPSFALNVNESGPRYPVSGVYVRAAGPGFGPDIVPCCGGVTTEYVRGSLFGSIAVRVIGVAVFLITLTAWLFATGGDGEFVAFVILKLSKMALSI